MKRSEKPGVPKRLFVLAGYRASGKTSALKLAEIQDHFPIFRPEVMDTFKLIAKQNSHLGNSGFHTFRHLRNGPIQQLGHMGIHYDLTNALQDATRRLFEERYLSKGPCRRTPQIFSELIEEQLEDGTFKQVLEHQFVQLGKLSSTFNGFELTVIQSDWETNRRDWISRTERTTDKPLDELQRLEEHSFNIALFAHDLKLGKVLYNYVHTCWRELLQKSGSRLIWIKRKGVVFDATHHDFSKSKKLRNR